MFKRNWWMISVAVATVGLAITGYGYWQRHRNDLPVVVVGANGCTPPSVRIESREHVPWYGDSLLA